MATTKWVTIGAAMLSLGAFTIAGPALAKKSGSEIKSETAPSGKGSSADDRQTRSESSGSGSSGSSGSGSSGSGQSGSSSNSGNGSSHGGGIDGISRQLDALGGGSSGSSGSSDQGRHVLIRYDDRL